MIGLGSWLENRVFYQDRAAMGAGEAREKQREREKLGLRGGRKQLSLKNESTCNIRIKVKS